MLLNAPKNIVRGLYCCGVARVNENHVLHSWRDDLPQLTPSLQSTSMEKFRATPDIPSTWASGARSQTAVRSRMQSRKWGGRVLCQRVCVYVARHCHRSSSFSTSRLASRSQVGQRLFCDGKQAKGVVAVAHRSGGSPPCHRPSVHMATVASLS